jgi:hypothetical protein
MLSPRSVEHILVKTLYIYKRLTVSLILCLLASRLIGPLNRFGNQLTNVFLNSLSEQKSIDAAKQLRYAEHYYEYSHKKLGRMSENCSNEGYNMNKHTKKNLHTMI